MKHLPIDKVNEIKNQHVHVLWSIIIVYITSFFLPLLGALFSGVLIGLIVEVVQYFFFDKKKLKLVDRCLDVSFWFIGSCLCYLSILFK